MKVVRRCKMITAADLNRTFFGVVEQNLSNHWDANGMDHRWQGRASTVHVHAVPRADVPEEQSNFLALATRNSAQRGPYSSRVKPAHDLAALAFARRRVGHVPV